MPFPHAKAAHLGHEMAETFRWSQDRLWNLACISSLGLIQTSEEHGNKLLWRVVFASLSDNRDKSIAWFESGVVVDAYERSRKARFLNSIAVTNHDPLVDMESLEWARACIVGKLLLIRMKGPRHRRVVMQYGFDRAYDRKLEGIDALPQMPKLPRTPSAPDGGRDHEPLPAVQEDDPAPDVEAGGDRGVPHGAGP